MTGDPVCHGKEEIVFQYLDSELPPAELAAFEQHLAGCAACRRLVADTELLFAGLTALPDVPAPVAEISVAVMARLPRPAAASPVERWIPALQLLVGAALLAFALPGVWAGVAPAFNLPEWSLADAASWIALTPPPGLPAGWLAGWSNILWAQLGGLSLWPLSPALAATGIAVLGLAWLASNALLLNAKPPHSLKNGGTL